MPMRRCVARALHHPLTLLQWDRFAAGGMTLFMAVPTVYAKLIAKYAQYPPEKQHL